MQAKGVSRDKAGGQEMLGPNTKSLSQKFKQTGFLSNHDEKLDRAQQTKVKYRPLPTRSHHMSPSPHNHDHERITLV